MLKKNCKAASTFNFNSYLYPQRFHEFCFPLSNLPTSNVSPSAEDSGEQPPAQANAQFHFAMYRGEENTLVGFSGIEIDDLDTIVSSRRDRFRVSSIGIEYRHSFQCSIRSRNIEIEILRTSRRMWTIRGARRQCWRRRRSTLTASWASPGARTAGAATRRP